MIQADPSKYLVRDRFFYWLKMSGGGVPTTWTMPKRENFAKVESKIMWACRTWMQVVCTKILSTFHICCFQNRNENANNETVLVNKV